VTERIRLFLVSPALAIRRALARSLDEEGEIVVVGEANSAVDALARAPAARPHVVLAGAHLRDPDTPEMCRRLHEAMPEAHILVVGVNASHDLVADTITAGAAGVVPHTIDETELMDAIRTAAAGRMVMSTDAFMDLLQGHARSAHDPLQSLTPLERELFDLLTGVTGVGPKVGLAFLSALQPDALRRAVVAGDADTLTVVPGVGKKVAQRVVLDLRDKLGGESELVAEGPLADVRDALLQLGLTPVEASEALRGMEVDGKPVEDLLREALQRVGR